MRRFSITPANALALLWLVAAPAAAINGGSDDDIERGVDGASEARANSRPWEPAAGQLRERIDRPPGLGGEIRRTLFFVPSGWSPDREWPLLVALHGITATPDEWVEFPRFLELADRHGFVVAIPDSIGFAGREGELLGLGEALADYVDSVIVGARDDLAATGEQWLIGFSAGGAGVWRLALRDAEAWTGVIALAPAGTPSKEEIAELRRLRIMIVQGLADTAVYVPRTMKFARALAEEKVISCTVTLEHAGHRLEAWPVMAMVFGFVDRGRCGWP